MEILLPTNTSFNLNQPTSKLIDSKMCVFDYSDKNDIDFFMKKITTFISYRYPTAEILVGGKYRVELPLNWRVMITDKHDFLCQLVGIEELLHFPNDTCIFNPYHVGQPTFCQLKIVKINPNPIEHFVPKLPKKNCLVIPLGTKDQWTNFVEDRDTGKITYYPECLIACDDIDSSKMELDLWNDIIV